MASTRVTDFLWRILPAVRTRERPRFLFFAGLYAILSFSQTLGLAGSEAIFLARRGPEGLPEAFILAAAVTVMTSLAYALVVGRSRNDRLFIVMLLGAAVLLAAIALISLWGSASAAAMALFCAFYAAQAVFITHYRTFATDFFDTLSSKRLFPGFAVGASVGGALGGAVALVLSRITVPEALVAGWALGLCAAAALLQFGHRNLRRWGPLGLEEADESSVEGLQGALRFLRRSPLARWMVISVVGMVLSLSLLHYLSSEIFVASYDSAEELAGFFGIYLAATNLLEIAVLLWITPRLIQRFGVAQSNLAHPLLTLGCFAAIGAAPILSVAVVARANREMIENALAGEVRSLSYNAVSFRFRGSMRALLEGIVFYAAMSVAGIAILLARDGIASSSWFAALGVSTALLYLAANWKVRGEYLKSLVSDIRAGRLDLDSIEAQLGPNEVARLAEQWEDLVEREHEHPSRASLELPSLLAERGFRDPLKRAVTNAHPRIRGVCLEALSVTPDASLASLLADGLHDPDAGVRLSAARAVGRIEKWPEPLAVGLRERLEDSAPEVRAEAALHLGEEGHATLRQMTEHGTSAEAVAALERLPDALNGLAASRLDDPDPAVRAAALRCLTGAMGPSALSRAHLERELIHDDPRVREAATNALAITPDGAAAALLAGALDDASRRVRERASRALGSLGDGGIDEIEEWVDGLRVWTVDAALSALARAGTPRARAVLERAFRRRVREAWTSLAALRVLERENDAQSAFLRTALGNAYARDQLIAFRILELIEDPVVVRSIRKALQFPSSRTRADALEVLSNLGDRGTSQLLALILEDGPIEDKLPTVARSFATPHAVEDVIRVARDSSDRWLQMAIADPFTDDSHNRDEAQTMQRLLALRNVPLFAHLSLEQLEAISRSTDEAHYLEGEVVVREGDRGDELFVVLEGEVRVYVDHGGPVERHIRTIPAPGYFGEVAILSNAVRTATIVVSEDVRLLTLGGERFKDLVRQAPELSFEVFRVLTEMVRSAEDRARASEERAREISP